MKVTIESVAARAEVSVGTVSRVLHGDPTVSGDLSRRVHDSVAALGYTPLRKRRAPAGGDSLRGKTIALLTLGMDRSLSRLPVVAAAVDGIREALGEAGAGLQILDASDPSREPVWLKRARFDGWLVKGAMHGEVWNATHDGLKTRLLEAPAVWFHGRPRGLEACAVGVNDWEVGALAARHLHALGHRRVAFLSPRRDHVLLKRRQHGFLATTEELGMDCLVVSENLDDWSFPLERSHSLAAIGSLLDRVLAQPSRPTAIFVPADSFAVLLYRAIAERGLRIGSDLGVISANREEGLIAGLFPSLATIDIRSEEVGREAVELLRRRLALTGNPPVQEVLIEPALVPGDSLTDRSS